MIKQYKYLMAMASGISMEAFSAIPTKVGTINVNSDDVMATIWEVAQLFFYYGAWIAIGVALIGGAYTIIGASFDAKKKGDSGILWSTIANQLVVIVVVMVIAILIISYMDI
ncbi:hypothetical protein [Candidatus Thiodubiliella endoseptemdiera]|uniref:hypothetical protein n=1 Tax=Candidatus Thiodubiliella endoseptemdiera TaxID=2738886 RepID=UPI0034DE31DD